MSVGFVSYLSGSLASVTLSFPVTPQGCCLSMLSSNATVRALGWTGTLNSMEGQSRNRQESAFLAPATASRGLGCSTKHLTLGGFFSFPVEKPQEEISCFQGPGS